MNSTIPPFEGNGRSNIPDPTPPPFEQTELEPQTVAEPQGPGGHKNSAEIPKTYSCKGCGGTTEYSPETQSLKCLYCGLETDIDNEAQTVVENDYLEWKARFEEHKAEQAGQAAEEDEALCGDGGAAALYAVTCKQCGATTNSGQNSMAHNCPFCGTPLVVEDAKLDLFWSPNYVVPFAFGEAGCSERFKKWMKGKWFAPEKVRRNTSLSTSRFNGVYIPYWTYDAQVETDYRGERGDEYRERDSNGNTRTVVRWSSASGHVSRFFNDILVPAVSSLDREVLFQVKDLKESDYRPFHYAYLAGFVTQTYTIDFVEGAEDAYKIIEAQVETDIKRDIGGDRQRIHWMDMDIQDRRFKLLVVPLWISSYKHKEKVYQVVINGLTGKVYGKFPISAWKVLLVVLLVIGLFVLLYYWQVNG